ncbi:hypothetical protein AVEN_250321-1 [Araneus ventricosus]|uniref:Uncharacterized protein n=1 Tax=Araneus ventricosus TaxID=182803 RepID=A0A4Y2FKM0_ARAVE|nr:hypothetical protein AVEN_250321-1 [Araneus ventricosus]
MKTDTAVTSVSEENIINCDIYLQTATVKIIGRNRSKLGRCLYDNASYRTFILEQVSKELNLKVIGQKELKVYMFGSTEPIIEKRNKVRVILKNLLDQRHLVAEALETPNISSALIKIPDRDMKSYCQRNNIRLADKSDSEDLKLPVLIGSDYYWTVVTGRIQRLTGALIACKSIFGWTASCSNATLNNISQQSANVMNAAVDRVEVNSNQEVDSLLHKFWELQAITNKEENETNEIDKDILNDFNKSIILKDGRYEVKLPFNDRVGELCDNYEIAYNRINSLVKRFKKNPEFYQMYKDVIKDYLKKGIAEEGLNNSEQILFYLPHQGVLKENNITTKLCVVFDASAHSIDAPSLNHCLSAGPNLNPKLLGILANIRLHKIAFTADIKQAFLQIMLRPDQCDAVRFLWLNKESETNYKILRPTHVIFAATCSPFLLAATLNHHALKLEEEFPRV